MSENPFPCNLAAWPSATMNTNVLELPMYSAASNRKQEFTLRRSPRPGRRWNLQTSSSPSPPLSHGADHPSGHAQPEFPHPEGADGPLRRGRGWGAVGSVHRSLPAGTRKLAESGGTGDRPLFQAMFGEAPTRREPDSPGGSPRLEPANQPKSRHDQLDIRSQESQKEVQIQVQHQAARDLAAAPSPNSPPRVLPASAAAKTHPARVDATTRTPASKRRRSADAALPGRSVSPVGCPARRLALPGQPETDSWFGSPVRLRRRPPATCAMRLAAGR